MLKEKFRDWLAGRPGDDESARAAPRIEEDAKTAAQLAWLRRALVEADEFHPAEPPTGLRARLEGLFDAHDRKPGRLRRYLAELVSDSWNSRPAPGMRGGTQDGGARHLLFSCQLLDVSVTLRPQPERKRARLMGQILAPVGLDPGLCSVQLTSDGGLDRFAEADKKGEFTFPDVPQGQYRVVVTGPGFEVLTPEFAVT